MRACLTIQAAYRGYITRHWYIHLRETTVYVQTLQRMKYEQKKYKQLRNATIKLQRRVRANQLGQKVKAHYLETRNKVIFIQAHWRGLKARENVERIKSAQVIQRWYRACVAGRRVRAQFVLLKKSVISMQACYRGNVARQQFRRERAARSIQAHVRGYFARALVKVGIVLTTSFTNNHLYLYIYGPFLPPCVCMQLFTLCCPTLNGEWRWT